jgi:hypothetical protein
MHPREGVMERGDSLCKVFQTRVGRCKLVLVCCSAAACCMKAEEEAAQVRELFGEMDPLIIISLRHIELCRLWDLDSEVEYM